MARATSTSTSTILAALLAAAAFGVWTFTGFVNRNLANLPIETIPNAPGQAKPFDTKGWLKTLAPVWVQSGQSLPVQAISEPVEEVFAAAPEVTVQPAPPSPPPAPNYAALLSTVMRIDGIASEGAFVNGKFYRIGEPISDFEYPEAGRQVVPVIVSVTATTVVVRHGRHLTELSV